MMIYPTIELQNGRCVSLHRGRIEEPQIWHVDPIAKARGFAADGAEWLHVTDLDWVAGGAGSAEIVQDIIRHAGIPVQIGGGFRSLDAISAWIEKGAGRIVVSSLAASNPEVVKQAAKLYPDQIVVAVDVFQAAPPLGECGQWLMAFQHRGVRRCIRIAQLHLDRALLRGRVLPLGEPKPGSVAVALLLQQRSPPGIHSGCGAGQGHQDSRHEQQAHGLAWGGRP